MYLRVSAMYSPLTSCCPHIPARKHATGRRPRASIACPCSYFPAVMKKMSPQNLQKNEYLSPEMIKENCTLNLNEKMCALTSIHAPPPPPPPPGYLMVNA